MPKLKKGAPRLTRTVRGTEQKRGKGWHTGQIAKAKIKAVSQAQSGRAAAREARERAAEQRYGSPEPSATASARQPARELKQGAKAANLRKRVRNHREKHAADTPSEGEDSPAAKRRKLRAAAADLPKDIGLSAPTRHTAFARDGRSADAARQSAEYNTRVASKHIKKLCSKGELEKAAAVLGGMLRDPDIRPLGFAMAAAVAPARPNARQKDALKKGAIVLSEDDHLQAMDAFAYN